MLDATQRASHTTPPAPDCSHRLGDYPGGRSRPSSYARARARLPLRCVIQAGSCVSHHRFYFLSLARSQTGHVSSCAPIPGPLPSRVIKSAGVETRDHTRINSRVGWAGRSRTYQWASRSSGCSFQASVAATFACGGVLDK